jgi:predicted N-acetyltransferase YhbS
LEAYDWTTLQPFWDFKPSWQNAITAIEKLKQSNISIGAYDNEKLVGYIIYNPVTKRIQQFSVDRNFRKRGVGSQLFKYISSHHDNEVAVINIDDTAKETL